MLVNAFYAIEQRKTPMIVSIGAVGLNLLLNWIFTVQFAWGHRGLALSTACIAVTNFLILYALMRRYLRLLETRAMVALLLKLALASAALIAVCWAGEHFALADWATQRSWSKAGWLTATIVVGALAFLGCAIALRIEELDQLRALVSRKLRRSRPAAS